MLFHHQLILSPVLFYMEGSVEIAIPNSWIRKLRHQMFALILCSNREGNYTDWYWKARM